MKRLNKPFAILGFFVVFLSCIFCPFLKVPLKASWNLYQVDAFLLLITYGILGLNVMFFFLRKLSALRISAIILLIWIIIAFLLVVFQINNFFGLKVIDSLLAKTLHLKWGWAVLFIGALMIFLSVKRSKSLQEEE